MENRGTYGLSGGGIVRNAVGIASPKSKDTQRVGSKQKGLTEKNMKCSK